MWIVISLAVAFGLLLAFSIVHVGSHRTPEEDEAEKTEQYNDINGIK